MKPLFHAARSPLCDLRQVITPQNPHVHWHSGFFVPIDQARSEAIFAEVINAYGPSRKVLVLTERTEHLDAIHVCSARTDIGWARRTQVTSDLTAI